MTGNNHGQYPMVGKKAIRSFDQQMWFGLHILGLRRPKNAVWKRNGPKYCDKIQAQKTVDSKKELGRYKKKSDKLGRKKLNLTKKNEWMSCHVCKWTLCCDCLGMIHTRNIHFQVNKNELYYLKKKKTTVG